MQIFKARRITVNDIPAEKIETPIDNHSSSDTIGAKIKGWEETMAAKKSPRAVRSLNPNSISWCVHEKIANYAKQPNLEYLPTIINDQLKSEHGLTDTDISSYYYSKKISGYLDNRELTPEEYEKMKKPIRVWWTTDLFWDIYEATKERIASEQTKQSSVLTSVVEESASTDDESE
ncbi:hypothetical protein [Enterococcus gilvus]|uniref:hypothetical protein n=1 Tax=Enterococcus gilvus TaxID=160453 RepID=UPI002909C26B|nr:hypothetical protein [Enterococcus gilvus]MDU5509811.1 hypothetical protein [Enterococcus gilvus]